MLRSEIVGAIKMRVYLSGMPELRLGLNDKVYVPQIILNNLNNEKVLLEIILFHLILLNLGVV